MAETVKEGESKFNLAKTEMRWGNDLDGGIANKERNVLYANRVTFNVSMLLKRH